MWRVHNVHADADSVAGQRVRIGDLQCSHVGGVLGISPRLLGVSPSRNVVASQFLHGVAPHGSGLLVPAAENKRFHIAGYRRLASHNNSLITRDYVLM